MRKLGTWILVLGVGWFVLSLVTLVALGVFENLTGNSVALPRAGNVEWVGVLLFFGVYFGSWVVVLIGATFRFAGKWLD